MSKDRPARTNRLMPPWSGMTLPGLAQGSATLRPDAPAIVEPDNNEALTGRKARLLSCKALLGDSDTLAHKLHALGLKPGDTVLVHLPNISDAILTLLAVQKLGAIPAVLPVFADMAEIVDAARLTNAAAIISLAGFAGLRPADICRDAAVDAMSVRFVAAFGMDLPEGVVSLDDWASVEFLGASPFPKIDGTDAALISFEVVAGIRRALVRSHEQLVAEAAAAASLSRIAAGTRLLSTLPPASAAGVLYGVALPLLTGAWIELNALFDSAGFAAQLGAGHKTVVILPGAAETAYRQFRGTRAIKDETLVLVHRPDAADPVPEFPADSATPRAVDVLCLGEAACLLSARGTRSATTLPERITYPVSGVLNGDAIGCLLEIGKIGRLALSGALVPVDRAVKGNLLATDYEARLTGDGHICLGELPAASASAA